MGMLMALFESIEILGEKCRRSDVVLVVSLWDKLVKSAGVIEYLIALEDFSFLEVSLIYARFLQLSKAPGRPD